MTRLFPNLASPWWLLLLLALPLLAWLHHRRSNPAALGALTYSRLPAGAGQGLWRGAWRLHLPFYARLAALACLALALARPQLGYAWEESLTEGIDIQLALDVSGRVRFDGRRGLHIAVHLGRGYARRKSRPRGAAAMVGFLLFFQTNNLL